MRRLGWIVAGAIAGLAVSAVAGVLAADRRARERFAVSARQVRERVEETGERWTAGAVAARDRVTDTTDQWRDSVVGTVGEWRDRGTEEMGRRLLSAAEARDATLEDDDADDATDADEPGTEDEPAAEPGDDRDR